MLNNVVAGVCVCGEGEGGTGQRGTWGKGGGGEGERGNAFMALTKAIA